MCPLRSHVICHTKDAVCHGADDRQIMAGLQLRARRPPDRSTARSGLCHMASMRQHPAKPPASYQSNGQFSGGEAFATGGLHLPGAHETQDFRAFPLTVRCQRVTIARKTRYDRNPTRKPSPRIRPRCLIAPPRSSSFSSASLALSGRSAGSGLSPRSGTVPLPHDGFRWGNLTMSANAVFSPRRAYRDGPDHVPAGTPLPPGRAELVISLLYRHAALARAGSAQNASPLDHIACRMAESLRATATTAFLWPLLAFSISPHRLKALSERERVSTWLAAS